MQDLSALREGWEFAEEEETRLLRELSIEEGLRQWAKLQQAFEWQLQQTAEIFEKDRKQALAQLQERLARLAAWQSRDGYSLSVDPNNPKSAD